MVDINGLSTSVLMVVPEHFSAVILYERVLIMLAMLICRFVHGLHSIVIDNFPRNEISLKIGLPVILLTNMNRSMRLCNSTCLLRTRLGERVFGREMRLLLGLIKVDVV